LVLVALAVLLLQMVQTQSLLQLHQQVVAVVETMQGLIKRVMVDPVEVRQITAPVLRLLVLVLLIKVLPVALR
jgi:hypothetical protein